MEGSCSPECHWSDAFGGRPGWSGCSSAGVALGATVAGGAVLLALVGASTGQDTLLSVAAATFMTVLPLSVAVAISRYRLYDLDRIISRSLLYTSLTVLVAAVYVVVVVLLGALAVRGEVVSGMAAVVAALAVAPIRSVAQRAIDRVLFGRRAEPFAVVSGLNRRLQESASPESALQVLANTVAIGSSAAVRLRGVPGRHGAGRIRRGSPRLHPVRLVASGGGGRSASDWPPPGRGRSRRPGARSARGLARHAGAAVRSVALVRDLQSPVTGSSPPGRRNGGGCAGSCTTASAPS